MSHNDRRKGSYTRAGTAQAFLCYKALRLTGEVIFKMFGGIPACPIRMLIPDRRGYGIVRDVEFAPHIGLQPVTQPYQFFRAQVIAMRT
jgi:hypothetical protein